MRYLIYLIVIFAFIWGWYSIPAWVVSHGFESAYACDFRMYYEAGRGNFDWKTNESWWNNESGFEYPHWTAITWFWCKYFTFQTAFLIWYILMCLCYLTLVSKLLRLDYGWLLALAGIKPLFICFQTGNIIPLVAILFLSPTLILLAICWKLWPSIGIVVHFLVENRRKGSCKSSPFYIAKARLSLPFKSIRDSLSSFKSKAETWEQIFQILK